MVRWLVQIEGEKFDTEEFPYWFPSGNVYAVSEGEKVFLVGEGLDALDDASLVHSVAVRAVEDFYAIICLLDSGIGKPLVGTVFREDDDGARRGFVFLSGTAAGRSKARGVLDVSGQHQSRFLATQAQEFLEASKFNRHLQVAVSLLAMPSATWPHLYRCLEEIESFLGKRVNDAGYCSKGDRERFTRTANTAEVSGMAARHGLGKFKTPSNPISPGEARSFIRQVLQKTLASVPRVEQAAQPTHQS